MTKLKAYVMLPDELTNFVHNIAQAGDSNMSSQQMLQLNNMIKTAPSSEIGDTIMSLTKAIQELQAKLDNLEKANKPNLNKLSEMNAAFDIPSNIDKNNGMGGM